jgi:hypothetical protein
MKYIILVGLLFCSGAAHAASFWIDSQNKTIHIAPKPVFEISNQEVKADIDHWFMVTFDLKYDFDSMKDQFDEIKAKYPQYKVRKVVINKSGSYELSVPNLDIHELIDPNPGVEGPYFTHTVFFAKSEREKIEKMLSNLESSVELKGSFLANIPVEKLVERAEISADVCDLFQKNGKNVFSAIENFPLVMREIERGAKTEKNQKLLVSMILNSCLEFEEYRRISSFQELLGLPLKVSPVVGGFMVENKETQIESTKVPLETLKRRVD